MEELPSKYEKQQGVFDDLPPLGYDGSETGSDEVESIMERLSAFKMHREGEHGIPKCRLLTENDIQIAGTIPSSSSDADRPTTSVSARQDALPAISNAEEDCMESDHRDNQRFQIETVEYSSDMDIYHDSDEQSDETNSIELDVEIVSFSDNKNQSDSKSSGWLSRCVLQ